MPETGRHAPKPPPGRGGFAELVAGIGARGFLFFMAEGYTVRGTSRSGMRRFHKFLTVKLPFFPNR